MNNLVKLRLKKGLSQVQIAEKLNIPLPTYQRYEHGDLPGEQRAIEMAKFFGCTTDYLHGLADTEQAEIETLSLDEKMLLNNYKQLEEKEKMELHECLSKMLADKKEREQQGVRVS